MITGSLIKASGAIHITHRINLIQKKLWNYLLKHAYNDLLKKTRFSISMSEIYALLGTRNDLYIKSLLGGFLANVAFNIFGKDNVNKWVRYQLLPVVYIQDGILYYEFGEEFSKLLYKPKYYALINIAIQQKLSSKFSLFLYELCLDYKGIGRTKWLTLDEFRYFMGINYSEFKDINKYVIKKAIAEINALTDIDVDLKVKCMGRKVIEIQFVVEEKQGFHTDDYIETSLESSIEPTVNRFNTNTFLPAVSIAIPGDDAEIEKLIKASMAIGVTEIAARQAVEQYGKQMFSEKLNMLIERADKVLNKTGWLLNSLKGNWCNSKVVDTQKTRISKQREEQRNRDLLAKLEDKHEAFLIERVNQVYEALSPEDKQYYDDDVADIIAEKTQGWFQQHIPTDPIRIEYLAGALLDEVDTDFKLWAKANKYELPESI